MGLPKYYNPALTLISHLQDLTEPEMRLPLLIPILALLPHVATADYSSFTTGPIIEDYGPVADVDVTSPVPPDAVLRHSFDVSTQAEDGEPNRTLISAARFINMHARAGIDADSISVAVIVHGKAIYDVSGDAPGNADVVAALLDAGAMTAHALLQQQGYTVNPF
jgi:intracellular sulfur oxidation DsrE/DsrF family protein